MDYILAEPGDIARLTDMRLAYIRDEQGRMDPQKERIITEQLPGYFQNHLNRDLFAFTAIEDGEMAATALLQIRDMPGNIGFPNGRIGTVLNVYTKPAFRKKGVSTRLMKQLLEYAGELGLDFVELEATEQGYPLYQKLGFRKHPSEFTPMRFQIRQEQ